MNMGYERKKMRGFLRKEPSKFGFLLLLGCFVISMALIGMSRHYVVSFPKLNFLVSLHATSSGLLAGDKMISRHRGNLLTEHAGEPLCDFSGIRSNICEMKGDIKIHGNLSSIIFITSSKIHESYRMKPHARKQDKYALSHVKELSVKSVSANDDTPKCTMKHNIPAIVFSTGGYMGNMFHDFTDVLIPLFITTHRFNGEVQFLVSDYRPWWILKYQPLLKQLSRYETIDFNKENEVHCFNEVIVGLKFHKEMSINPSRTPNGYSMVDFAKLIRRSFTLQRESAINLHENHDKKPRLLIISRRRTRSFMNINEVVQMASELNYEVLVEEAGLNSNLGNFSQVVNSCDVLMGVHGAGLTNLVFLPTNAVVIQVVPLGGLESIAYEDFGVPSIDMKLRYLQYSISEAESSLIEQYPRDHPVFKDPATIRKQGWLALRSTYLINQNVKLDVGRFRGVLLEALDLLHQQVE
ncbi:EGF domain-specific O-linked N-acetylglucosamine transferase-like isoform X1 [Ananas comosus]|uniref:EGF domain-specific O-linked N-acetylglucosamine transferase-like isoform X1 n=1 Tax=Ananas comosus TaxID=4615 RepID=A0A6P5G580_ANACO|nr:EGF domain-specific O-linked N-acetylglucosamine transferase-like isoform X1 [Ananas comosus]XP_020100415.1 EGF domain-specific O-linked N-acetylglucosamine transferase-like isoform X1 [Ananas comosus]